MRRRYLGAALALALATALGVVALAPTAGAGTTRTYIVLYKQLAVAGDATAKIQAAGGTLVASYPQIGVTIARSSNDGFAATMKKDLRIQRVSATNGFGVQLPDAIDEGSDATAVDPSAFAPAPGSDNLSGLQWDMDQIHAPAARAINGGDPSVVVGDIDTGLDYTHPDLAANVDDAASANCVSGVAAPGRVVADDDNGHGTHTAGTIAAALNGVGIVGVAPNVKIAGIKAGNEDGFFFPEAVVCSFMWAATHGIDVTNNSYFADPWLFNCKTDPTQRAIWIAESRAIQYAESQGVVVVAAAGNENIDLAKTAIDNISPDNSTPVTREVTNACGVVPVDVPGVVGVSGDGNLMQKAYFSSYGVGTISVVAPSGDRRLQVTPAAPNGRVLSTYPSKFFVGANPLFVQDCSVSPCATYAYLQGTSMASPHVAGVAALIRSRFPGLSPGAVTAMLQSTADPMACPAENPQYPFNPPNGLPGFAHCTGGPAYNSFFGHGQVNALTAVGG